MTMAPFKRLCDLLGISPRTRINLKSQKKIDWLIHLDELNGEEKNELWVDVEKRAFWFSTRGFEFPAALSVILARWSVSIQLKGEVA